MKSDKQTEYTHREAFCIMQYQCEGCAKIFRMWNSRDGVTPFIISSLCCDNSSASHVNFGADVRCQHLVDGLISGVFVNMTEDRAKDRSDNFWILRGKSLLDEFEHLREIGEEKLRVGKIDEYYGDGENPDVLPVDEYVSTYGAPIVERERSFFADLVQDINAKDMLLAEFEQLSQKRGKKGKQKKDWQH